MTADLDAVLRYDRQTARMYADPAVTGDLLAVGLALARLCRDGERKIKMSRIADWLGWRDWRRVMATLADDRPRYVPDWSAHGRGCRAPMVRRDGTCGRPPTASTRCYERDPHGGGLHAIAHCARHRDWAAKHAAASERAWRALGSPQPQPNTGGALARYFDCDWPRVYRWADPRWAPPSTAPPRPGPPRLTLLPGDGEDSAPVRPALAVLR